MLGVMSFSLPPLMVMVVALLKNVARGEFMPTQHTILYNEKLLCNGKSFQNPASFRVADLIFIFLTIACSNKPKD